MIQNHNLGRFVLVLAIIAGMLSIRTSSMASPQLQVHPPVDKVDHEFMYLQNVLVDPVVTETSAAKFLLSIGVAVSENAAAAIVAQGEFSEGVWFEVQVGDKLTGDSVLVFSDFSVPLI